MLGTFASAQFWSFFFDGTFSGVACPGRLVITSQIDGDWSGDVFQDSTPNCGPFSNSVTGTVTTTGAVAWGEGVPEQIVSALADAIGCTLVEVSPRFSGSLQGNALETSMTATLAECGVTILRLDVGGSR